MPSSNDQPFSPKAEVTRAAMTLLEKAKGDVSIADLATAVDKATTALRLASDLETTPLTREKLTYEVSRLRKENETLNERQRSESWRNFVIAISPFLTVLTFTVGLIVQKLALQHQPRRRE